MFKGNKWLLRVPLQGPVLKRGIGNSRSSCHYKLKWDHGVGGGPESRESGKTHDSYSMNKLARYTVNSSDAEQK